MNLNLDELKDPEEFFGAFVTQEKAEKELKKLRGETYTDTTQHKPSTEDTKTKKVGYKQQYSSVVADLGTMRALSQVPMARAAAQEYQAHATQKQHAHN
ncbi:hypothetical protein IFM89_031457 [Coptis chinensis]|uniref:Uncharacterized protein n=1 Tax=Coptis chinensis TaxID=261450 RepID=A0A835HI68_9MAGN|nr:hypothetical protein IFM89_031457 [Coptis chinensis]